MKGRDVYGVERRRQLYLEQRRIDEAELLRAPSTWLVFGLCLFVAATLVWG